MEGPHIFPMEKQWETMPQQSVGKKTPVTVDQELYPGPVVLGTP